VIASVIRIVRLSKVSRIDLTEKQRKAFDKITRDLETNTSTGPGAIELNSPQAFLRVISLSRYLQKKSVVPPRLRELAILVIAHELDSDYVWKAHSSSANRRGIDSGLVETIRTDGGLTSLKEDDRSTIMFVRELLGTNRVREETFQAALSIVGRQGLTELTMLIGYYSMVAFLCNAFEA